MKISIDDAKQIVNKVTRWGGQLHATGNRARKDGGKIQADDRQARGRKGKDV